MARPKRKADCHPDKRHVAFGLCSRCYFRRQWAGNPEEVSSKKRRELLKHRFNITPEQYEEMLVMGAGCCWICGKPPKKKRLAVDHCHKTKRVRGLLCWWCNNRIVTSRVTPDMLRTAAEYLESQFDGRRV